MALRAVSGCRWSPAVPVGDVAGQEEAGNDTNGVSRENHRDHERAEVIARLPVSVVAATAPGLPAIEVAGRSLSWRISVATPAHRRVSAASRAFLAELLRAAGSSP